MNADLVNKIRDEVAAACADAEISPAMVRIWLFDDDPFEPQTAPSVHYRPDWTIEEDDDEIFDGNARADANSEHNMLLHRIGVHVGIDADDPTAVAAVAGLLRHEFEHARQYDGPQGIDLKNLDGLADTIASHIDGCTGVEAYRSRPVEASANAATAAFLARRHPEQRAALADTKSAPFAADGGTVVAPDQLARLTVEWIADREQIANDAHLFTDGLDWDERLDREMPGASRWRS